jgi:hypothetical protein
MIFPPIVISIISAKNGELFVPMNNVIFYQSDELRKRMTVHNDSHPDK